MNQLAPWHERMRAAAAEQKRIQDEKRAAMAAAAPPAAPATPGLWNGMTWQQRMVQSTLARDRAECEARKPHPIAPQETTSQYIDAAYAQALSQKLQGAAAEAVQKVEARKAVAQMKTESK